MLIYAETPLKVLPSVMRKTAKITQISQKLCKLMYKTLQKCLHQFCKKIMQISQNYAHICIKPFKSVPIKLWKT